MTRKKGKKPAYPTTKELLGSAWETRISELPPKLRKVVEEIYDRLDEIHYKNLELPMLERCLLKSQAQQDVVDKAGLNEDELSEVGRACLQISQALLYRAVGQNTKL